MRPGYFGRSRTGMSMSVGGQVSAKVAVRVRWFDFWQLRRTSIRGTREPAARPVMVPEATAASPDTRPIEPTPSAAMPARLEAPARVRMARVNRQPEGR